MRRSLGIGDGGWMLPWRDDTRAVEVSWIRQLMGDSPLDGICWDQDADKDRVLLDRMHRLFPEANIEDEHGALKWQADKSLRRKRGRARDFKPPPSGAQE